MATKVSPWRSGLAVLAVISGPGCFDYASKRPAHGAVDATDTAAADGDVAEIADADTGSADSEVATAADVEPDTPAETSPEVASDADTEPDTTLDVEPEVSDVEPDVSDVEPDTAETEVVVGPVTFDLVHAFFVVKCDPCHAGATAAGSQGEHNMANPDVDVAYAASQLESSAPPKTKGELALQYVRIGVMPLGVGCTGRPEADADKPDCLTAAEIDLLARWIADGQLPPAQ